MLGTIVFVEEPRSKAEQGAEFSQKIFSLPGVPGLATGYTRSNATFSNATGNSLVGSGLGGVT